MKRRSFLHLLGSAVAVGMSSGFLNLTRIPEVVAEEIGGHWWVVYSNVDLSDAPIIRTRFKATDVELIDGGMHRQIKLPLGCVVGNITEIGVAEWPGGIAQRIVFPEPLTVTSSEQLTIMLEP